jgi:hypothetical protein
MIERINNQHTFSVGEIYDFVINNRKKEYPIRSSIVTSPWAMTSIEDGYDNVSLAVKYGDYDDYENSPERVMPYFYHHHWEYRYMMYCAGIRKRNVVADPDPIFPTTGGIVIPDPAKMKH